MKSYKDLEAKQIEYEIKFNELANIPHSDRTTLATYGQWIDFIGELLIHNVVEYAHKIGYDFEKNEELFEFTDEAKSEMVINEQQAREMLDIFKKNYKSNPNRTESIFCGINMDKINIEILEWILE